MNKMNSMEKALLQIFLEDAKLKGFKCKIQRDDNITDDCEKINTIIKDYSLVNNKLTINGDICDFLIEDMSKYNVEEYSDSIFIYNDDLEIAIINLECED